MKTLGDDKRMYREWSEKFKNVMGQIDDDYKRVIKWIEEDGVLEKGLSVLLVVTSTDPSKPNYPPKDWLYNEKWQYPVIYDDSNNSIANYFGVQYFPSWVFTEGDKSIAMTYAGKISKEELSKLIN